MEDPTTGACPPAPPYSVTGSRSAAAHAGGRLAALIAHAASLLRLAGSQCCVGRSQTAWERMRERDAAAVDADRSAQ